jgi:hypothetical protein
LSLSPTSPSSRPAIAAQLVRGLPGPRDHLTDAAHRLAVARHHADGADVVQHVLGGNRLAADATFGEGHVFRHVLVEVMTDHEHVQMLVEGVDGERPRGIGGTWQHVQLTHTLMMSGA